MSERKLRFTMIGTGNFGTWFSKFIRDAGDLVAISEPNPKARDGFAKATGLKVPAFEDYERLLEKIDFDAVVITGPNYLHKPITVAAAKAGKHVFCEKAMAPTVADCWEMVRACEAANVRLMVGHKRRLRPPWARMIELREQLGPVVALSTVGYFNAGPEEFHGWWGREAESGGLLMLSGVHEIDWMRAMCGDVAAVSAIAGSQVDKRYDFSDSMQVTLRFQSGAIGSLGVSLSYPLNHYREVCGSDVVTQNGGMRLISSFQSAEIHWQLANEVEPHREHYEDPNGEPVGADAAFRREVGDFVRWVTEGATPCLTWREGLRCVEVIEAARHSARHEGKWVQLPLYPELEN